MDKKGHSVSLSFILLRYGFAIMVSMLFCGVIWFAGLSFLESHGIVYPGHIGNQQVEELIESSPDVFQRPEDDFLADYALFGKDGKLIVSNTEGRTRQRLIRKAEENTPGTLKHTYADGSYAVFNWHFRKEFSNPVWRVSLPPFEYLWWTTLGIACVLSMLWNARWLRSRLADKLQLFQEVSEKVGAQELDFQMPHAGIKEFDQALNAMEQMRQALYTSLSSQWAAQQRRDSEMSALAHDLKTPITLIGGNAELLLEEDLKEDERKMVETILHSNERAKQYVLSLLETSRGEEESFESISLDSFFESLHRNAWPIAEKCGVRLEMQNKTSGSVLIQEHHLSRAIGNVIQNAIEHTPEGGTVTVTGSMLDAGWQLTVLDDGPGFSHAALLHGAERLWRDDRARAADGHNGLGLWFASQVVEKHGGKLLLRNGDTGGIVTIQFSK